MTSDPERTDGREERGEQTRQALLHAAREAFAEKGFAGASVRDIASRADAHPALVGYHFGGKAKLFRRVVDEAVVGLRDRLLATVGDAKDRSPREVARDMLRIYLDVLQEEPRFPQLLQRGLLDGDETVVAILREHFAILGETAAAVLPGDPQHAKHLFLTMWSAALVPWLYRDALDGLLGKSMGPEVMAERADHLDAVLARLLPDE